MRIAVNARFLLDDYREGYGNFIYEIFSRLIKMYPRHDFIFIYDRKVVQPFGHAKNVHAVIAGPAARHPVLWKWWYDITIPRVLKKQKADVFVSCDGFCSLTTKVPQCLIVHDLAYLHEASTVAKSHLLYYRRFIPRFVKYASRVATVSAFSKKDISHQLGVDENKISLVQNGVKDIFRPLTFEQKQHAKEKYTQGREYFAYTGAIHPRKNLINLLKAFSLFKKRQQSGMKLVIAGRFAWKNEEFASKLKTYRYRDDVVLTGFIPDEELALVTGAAYGMIYPSTFEGFGVPVIEAMKSGVPVITSKGTAMEEASGGIALLADPHDPKDIAEQMMLLYKDENRRNNMIAEGLEYAQSFTWEKSAAQMWEWIGQAVS